MGTTSTFIIDQVKLRNASGTVINPATEDTLASLNGKFTSLGQKAMAGSVPVTLASDQSPLAVSQSGTWNINNITGTISLPTGAATAALQQSILASNPSHTRDTNNEQPAGSPLGAGAVFEGTFTKISEYDHFEILYAATTPFTAVKIWSNDGVNPLGGVYGESALTTRLVSGYNVIYDVNEGRNMAPYYKLKITNGATPQGAFPAFISLNWLIREPYAGSFGFLDASLTNLSKALLVRSATPQLTSTLNSTTRTSAHGATEYVGTWEPTREIGAVRNLIVLSSNVASGLGGTFTFQYGPDGTAIDISESRTITDFATVRDFDLFNAGKYFRIKFTPSRALTGSETVTINTTHSTAFSGPFVRLANQEIEEQNAALGQTFAYLKAFDEVTGKSVNLRPIQAGTVITSTAYGLLVKNVATGQQPDGDYVNQKADGTIIDTSTALGAGGSAQTFTVDTATNELIKVAHGLSNGQHIVLSTTNTLPAGLDANTVYIVSNATTDRFKVTNTLKPTDAGVVDITSGGTGTHSYATRTAFVSANVDTDGWRGIELLVDSDQISATNGCVLEFLDDIQAATPKVVHVVALSFATSDLLRGSGLYFKPTASDGFRVRYVNGVSAQTYFRLLVNLRVQTVETPQATIESSITGASNALLARVVIWGKIKSGPSAGEYIAIAVNSSGQLAATVVGQTIGAAVGGEAFLQGSEDGSGNVVTVKSGQRTMANSLSMAIASDDSHKIFQAGQATMANSAPVVIASDQSALSSNLTLLNGTAVDTNSGSKSAGTLRVVLATDQPQLTNKLLVTPDANSQIDLNRIVGTTVDVNSGNKSAGTMRVVLATDQPALANSQPIKQASADLPNFTYGTPSQATVGATAGNLVGSTSGFRKVTIKVIATAVTGIYINANGAATSAHFLLGPGEWRVFHTAQAISAIRAGASDVVVFVESAV